MRQVNAPYMWIFINSALISSLEPGKIKFCDTKEKFKQTNKILVFESSSIMIILNVSGNSLQS